MNPAGSTADTTPDLVAVEQLKDCQKKVADAAARAEQVQEVIMHMEEDLKRPCNLKTHHDPRLLPFASTAVASACYVRFSWGVQLMCETGCAGFGSPLGYPLYV